MDIMGVIENLSGTAILGLILWKSQENMNTTLVTLCQNIQKVLDKLEEKEETK